MSDEPNREKENTKTPPSRGWKRKNIVPILGTKMAKIRKVGFARPQKEKTQRLGCLRVRKDAVMSGHVMSVMGGFLV